MTAPPGRGVDVDDVQAPGRQVHLGGGGGEISDRRPSPGSGWGTRPGRVAAAGGGHVGRGGVAGQGPYEPLDAPFQLGHLAPRGRGVATGGGSSRWSSTRFGHWGWGPGVCGVHDNDASSTAGPGTLIRTSHTVNVTARDSTDRAQMKAITTASPRHRGPAPTPAPGPPRLQTNASSGVGSSTPYTRDASPSPAASGAGAVVVAVGSAGVVVGHSWASIHPNGGADPQSAKAVYPTQDPADQIADAVNFVAWRGWVANTTAITAHVATPEPAGRRQPFHRFPAGHPAFAHDLASSVAVVSMKSPADAGGRSKMTGRVSGHRRGERGEPVGVDVEALTQLPLAPVRR